MNHLNSTKLRIHYFQHVPFEGLGIIKNWAESKGHLITATRFYFDYNLPNINDFDWLIVMGGPMSVNEEHKYKWLKEEKRIIERAIEKEKTVIGICLGAQLIADVLEAQVYHNKYKEIGWFPIFWTNEARESRVFYFVPKFNLVFHWHGETFDIPKGFFRIASSEACKNQGFIDKRNKIIGLQFHLEITMDGVIGLINNCREEIVPAPYIMGERELIRREKFFSSINDVMIQLLESLKK